MERIHRALHRNYMRAHASGFGGMCDFEPARPWNEVWKTAADDDKFWKRELEDPAFFIMSKLKPLSASLGAETSDSARPGPAKRPFDQASYPASSHAQPASMHLHPRP
eukprot:11602438-Heterocapsa_arctica.AAC.1